MTTARLIDVRRAQANMSACHQGGRARPPAAAMLKGLSCSRPTCMPSPAWAMATRSCWPTPTPAATHARRLITCRAAALPTCCAVCCRCFRWTTSCRKPRRCRWWAIPRPAHRWCRDCDAALAEHGLTPPRHRALRVHRAPPQAFAIVATGETRIYGNLLLKKGRGAAMSAARPIGRSAAPQPREAGCRAPRRGCGTRRRRADGPDARLAPPPEAQVLSQRVRLPGLHTSRSSAAASRSGRVHFAARADDAADMPLGAVREMIPRLEAGGLIRTVPQRGLQIAHVDPEADPQLRSRCAR